jgi:hypothetical protein
MYYEGNILKIEMHAEHYLEPISNYLIITNMKKEDVKFKYKELCVTGFDEGLKLQDGTVCNGQFFRIERGTVPGFPIVIEGTSPTNKEITILGVLHEKQQSKWEEKFLVNGKRNA